MGLAGFFTRNLDYAVTDTVSGAQQTFTVITDGMGAYPEWSRGDYSGGMSIPGADRAATLLSDLIGSIPWHAFRERAGLPMERISPTPALLAQPGPPHQRVTTFSSWAMDLIWHGNAIGIVAARDRAGWPVATIPVPADQVLVGRVGEADNVPLPRGSIGYSIGGQWYGSDDVIHVMGRCRPGALRGRGVLENHFAGSLTLAGELAKQAGAVGKHAVPSVVITADDPDFTEDDAAAVKASWMRSQVERQPAVVNSTLRVEPMAWNPTETQLIEARKFSLHDMALIFGLDPSWLGVSGASMTYSNIEQEAINLLKYSSLTGHLARFEAALSAALPRGTYAKANLDGLLRADTRSRYDAHEIALRNGWLTRDEVRALEDRPPLTAEQRAEYDTASARPAADAADTTNGDPR